MAMLSVISSLRSAGRMPAWATASSMTADSSLSWNWRGDRLTLICRWMPASCQRRSCWQALRRIHSPSALISPSSSMIGMKRGGGTRPISGCSQRIRASTPTMQLSLRRICGW
ncbi:hypothetical protein D3C78_1210460 [compost metagenome]